MPSFAKRVVERLLNHVADPSRRSCHENPEWQRLHMSARNLVANELVADLRSVSVDDAEIPAITRKIDDRREAFTRVAELIGDRRSLAGRRESVSSECYNGCSRRQVIHARSTLRENHTLPRTLRDRRMPVPAAFANRVESPQPERPVARRRWRPLGRVSNWSNGIHRQRVEDVSSAGPESCRETRAPRHRDRIRRRSSKRWKRVPSGS